MGQPVDPKDNGMTMKFGDIEGDGLMVIGNRQLQLSLASNGSSSTGVTIGHVETDRMG